MALRCFAYSFAKDLDFKQLKIFFADRYRLAIFDDVLHVQPKQLEKKQNNESADAFIFSYGAIVCWGFSEAVEQQLIQELSQFLRAKLGAEDDDLYNYSYANTASIEEDNIVLPNHDAASKLACSYGLAQSVKLGGFEGTIDNIISKTKDLPEQLAKDGSIHLSRKDTRKLMGRIFIDRNSINLHLKLLDVPNFFWENTELEPLYEMITEYTSQKQRVALLNKQLEVMHELLEMLTNELNNQHSSKLEWIIIILIFIEVTVIVAKDILHIL